MAPDTNDFFGIPEEEQISQSIEQANNHHAMLYSQSKSLRTKLLFQDIIVFIGEKSQNMLILRSRNTLLKPA